ncbi:MAG: PAS domain-containing protein [Deltaproteobacteria bacterium]|nr:PAS domain-containing protein [Deltaproteobacteria bacterium]
MISRGKLFLLVFLPAASLMVAVLAVIQEKNRELSRAQFESLLQNQWYMASLLYRQDGAAEAFAKIARETGLRVTVVLEGGDVLWDSEAEPPMEAHGGREEIRRAFWGEPSFSERRSVTTGKTTMYYAARTPEGPVLRVAYPLDYYEGRAQALLGQTFYALLALLGVVALIALAVFRATGRTFRELGEAVRAAKEGKESVQSFRCESLDSALFSLGAFARDLKESNLEKELLNERLRFILQNVSDGVLLFQNDEILYANLSAERILGAPLPARISLGKDPELIARLLKLSRGEEPAQTKILGKVVFISQKETESGFLAVLREMSDAEKYSLYKSDLIGNISHELRTPLAIILTAAEVVAKEPEMGDATRQKFLETISRNGRRLELILDDLTLLHKLEVGSDEEEGSETDLAEAVGEIRETVASGEKTINFRRDGGLAHVRASHLLSVLSNLIGNAVKYSSGPEIDVTLTKEGGVVTVAVSDWGPAIPPEERERIFERFYSISKSRSRERSGTGLGLSIVKHIALIYQGEVTLTENERGGNVFTVKLMERRPKPQP